MKKFFWLILMLSISLNANAGPIISAISNNQINIDTNFRGAEILLFGVKAERGNILVVLRGPKRKYMITKKEKLLGIWHNGQRLVFDNVYSYYSIFSSADNLRLKNNLLNELEIGPANLELKAEENDDPRITETFKLELIDNLARDHLYSVGHKNIDFLNDNLFKIVLKFPKNIPYGVYTAEIYLIKDSNLVAFQSIPIFVNQVGNNAKILNFAYNYSFLYALIAILIAIVAGFIANYVFSRFVDK